MEVDTPQTLGQEALESVRQWMETSESNLQEALNYLNEANQQLKQGTAKYSAEIEKHQTKAMKQYKGIHAQLTKPYHQQESEVSFQHGALTRGLEIGQRLQSSMRPNLGGLSHVYRVLSGAQQGAAGHARPAIFPAKLHLAEELELEAEAGMVLGGGLPQTEHVWISTELYPILRPVGDLRAEGQIVLRAERHNPHTLIHPWGLTVHPSRGELLVTEHNRSIITGWFCTADLAMRRVLCLGGEQPTLPPDSLPATASEGDVRAGALQRPRGIAVSLQGRIAIAETDAHRVQLYTPDWKLVRTLHSVAAEPSRLASPYHVAFDPDDNLFVADTCNNRVLKFDSKGDFLLAIQRNTAAQNPQERYRGNDFFQSYVNGIAVDKDGLLLVVYAGANHVRVFRPDGSHARDIPLGYTLGNQGWAALARGPDRTVLVSDYNNNRVCLHDYDGKMLRQIRITRPTCAVYDLEGRLFVVSHDRSAIHCF